MKNLLIHAILITIIGCNSAPKDISQMRGAYFMISQTVNDGNKETRYTDLKQLKIYTDSFMMYTQVNSVDSISAFGVGSYKTSPATVTEDEFFSAYDSTSDNMPASYKLDIIKTVEGYTQTIPEIKIGLQKSKLTEEYKNMSKPQKTMLDGVWKQIDNYSIHGNDTTRNQHIQYKTFYAGYFMWGQSSKDSTGKKHTGIGFGTYEWINPDKIIETNLNSTYSIIVGQPFDIDIDVRGPDIFKQTILNADGSKSVEFYKKVKK